MKKIVCLFLTTLIIYCLFPVAISAEETEVYKTIAVEYSDNRGKTEQLDVLIKDNNVYVNAETLSKRFGFACNVNNDSIVIKNESNSNFPTTYIIFSCNNTKIKKMLFTNFIDSYEAPFVSVINNKGAWIPFEYSLLIMNGGLLIVDNCLLIDIPQKTITDCFTEVMKKTSTYNFDWNKDFGYTDWDMKVLGADSHLINLFSGLLDFDGYSWSELFQSFVLDSSSYDSKYGKDLALLLCTESDEELKASIEQMDFTDELLDGHLGTALKIQSDSINGSAENLYNQCNNLLSEISSGNSSSVSMYNRTYREYEKALNKQTWFSKTGENILQIQDGLSSATKALKAISKIAEVVSYGKEFTNQDEFSLSALKNYLSTSNSNSDLPKAMKESMITYSNRLSEDVLTYSAKRFFDENIDDLISDAATIGESLGSQANIALFAWNIASNVVPFISNGLDSADKYELALYSQVFQADSFLNYQQKRDGVFNNIDKITSENLYTVSQYLYIYLKTCYITRNAALGSLNGKSNATKEKAKPLIEYQNKINADIARITNIVKNANKTNENNVYGFLPSDNQKYIKEHDNNQLFNFFNKQESTSFTGINIIKKSLSEITELMGNDYQLNKQQFSTAFGSKPVLMIYNEATMPGLAVCPSYSSGIYQDIENGVNVREKIQQGSYTYDGIAVYGSGKLNENISADMTYNDLATEIGDFDTQGVGQETLVYTTEMDGYKVSYYFSTYEYSGLSDRIKNGKITSADMKTVNPKINSIAIFKDKNNTDNSSSNKSIEVRENDTLSLSGTLATEDYVTNTGDKKTVTILNLDKPIDCYLYADGFYDGKTKYTIESVQLDVTFNLRKTIGNHIAIQGKVMLAHTIHHRRDIIICDISETSDN